MTTAAAALTLIVRVESFTRSSGDVLMIDRKRLGSRFREETDAVGAPDFDAGLWLTRDPSTAEPLRVIVPGLYVLPVVRLLTPRFTEETRLSTPHNGRSTFTVRAAGCSSVGRAGRLEYLYHRLRMRYCCLRRLLHRFG